MHFVFAFWASMLPAVLGGDTLQSSTTLWALFYHHFQPDVNIIAQRLQYKVIGTNFVERVGENNEAG